MQEVRETQFEKIVEIEKQNIVQTYARTPLQLTHGEGVFLFDVEGNRYLDMGSGIAVNALGHAHPKLMQTISQNAHSLLHTSNLFYHKEPIFLAQKLVERSFADKVFFCNSGTEANEAALKFARKYARAKGHTHKTKVIAFHGGFHGRTLGALSATSKPQYREPFEPLVPGVSFASLNSVSDVELLLDSSTCAVLIEPIQGEGGVQFAQPEFLRFLRDVCRNNDTLLIFDEVQCGLGRTGKLWAHEHSDVQPDIMTLAKPLGGGLPLGATLVTQDVAQTIRPGDHGTTFGGNPFVCALANVLVDEVCSPSFLGHVEIVGYQMQKTLLGLQNEHPKIILEVRGKGLIWGLDLTVPASQFQELCFKAGVLLLTAGEKTLRLLPPLIIQPEQLSEFAERLNGVLFEMNKEVAR